MMLYVARCKRAGFTLIEIMIVIAIIAILAAVVVPNFMVARAEAQLAGCRQNIMNLVKAIELATVRCSYDELIKKVLGGTSPTTIATHLNGLADYLLENGYLASQPRCPAASTPDDGTYYAEVVYSEKQDVLNGGLLIVCSATSECRHHLADKHIRPAYFITQKGVTASSLAPDGLGGSGWCDYVYDL